MKRSIESLLNVIVKRRGVSMSCRVSELEQLQIENSVLHSLVLGLNNDLKNANMEISRLRYKNSVIHALGGGSVGKCSLDVKTGR